jgi:MoaA/NifB/PqqE/SkfB family radical SAM enzyme
MSWKERMRELGFARSIGSGRTYNCLLQVTNRCNMKCSFCDFWPNGVPPQEELSIEEFRSLSRQLSGLGRCLLSIEGGEPFVRPDLVEIVRAFSDDHLPVLFTNGWYVTAENAKALFEAGLAQAGVSVDYAEAARHDAKRVLPGAFERAWKAVDAFKAAAPHGGKQVHVMTVLMSDNVDQIEPLLERSAARGVGHVVTLLSKHGYRRGKGVDEWPTGSLSGRLLALWRRFPHWRFWREYVERMDAFLSGGAMPTCRAGIQSLNVDHVGNVSACVERIDRIVGNIRREPLAAIHARLAADREEVSKCQKCWTVCRGFSQLMSGGGTLRGWWDMATRMRSM